MKQQENRILVPWDFSQVAEYALEHAVQFITSSSGSVSLLHIVKKEKEIKEAKEKLNTVAKNTESKYNIKPEVIIKEGTIFTEITNVANELDASLLIMGTHGIKGIQKLTGSYALKVIADTKAPFIVVQKPPERDKIQDVVFPVDARKEIKQKLNQAKYLSQFYQVKFHICMPGDISGDTKKRTIVNLNFIKGYFQQHSVEHEVHTIEGAKNFADATLHFAKKHRPDLLLIMITRNIGFTDYILGAEEQRIIANEEKIPVMCVNPLQGKWSLYTK